MQASVLFGQFPAASGNQAFGFCFNATMPWEGREVGPAPARPLHNREVGFSSDLQRVQLNLGGPVTQASGGPRIQTGLPGGRPRSFHAAAARCALCPTHVPPEHGAHRERCFPGTVAGWKRTPVSPGIKASSPSPHELAAEEEARLPDLQGTSRSHWPRRAPHAGHWV